MRKEISDELGLISRVVSAIPSGNVYSVPEGYFETVPSQILSVVHADSAIDPLISGINGIKHLAVQEVPDGYFDSLAANILKKALLGDEAAATEIRKLSPDISAIGKAMPYTMPEGFFNNFSKEVLNAIRGLGNKQIQDENPAFLQELRQKNPYTVPENYFTTLASEIIGQVAAPAKTKVVKMFPFRRVMQYASAAVIAGVILAGTLIYFGDPSNTDPLTTQQISSFDSIPIEELERYVSNQPAINMVSTSIYASAELENEDIREILSDVSETDLQQYLVNYTDINLQNTN